MDILLTFALLLALVGAIIFAFECFNEWLEWLDRAGAPEQDMVGPVPPISAQAEQQRIAAEYCAKFDRSEARALADHLRGTKLP